jgi:hypothetical protein
MTKMATVQRKPGDHPFQAVHENDREWETLRFPGQHSKMLFHPSPERPTDPNAGFVRYEPGAHHPLHRHDFAQVWYILEGEFDIGGTRYGPGRLMLFVQYQGPTTGGRPIYDGRFNVQARKPLEQEQLDV